MRRNAAALHTLVGAYVLDAVSEAERVAFEQHLTRCEPCREEVSGLREATARLAAAAATEARADLREQTLQAATRLRQLPPSVGPVVPVRRANWRSILAVAAAVIAILFAGTAIGLGVHMSSMQDRLTATESRDHAIAMVVGASDAVTLTAQVRTGGTATVVMSHQARALVFTARKLPALPATKAYELWVMSPSGPISAGVLPPAHSGMSGPMVVHGLQAGDRIGLTVEPVAGSPRPTSAPLVMLGLGT